MIKSAIEKKAKEVNNISLDYHLSHATFACDKLIETAYRDFATEHIRDLREKIYSAYKRRDEKTVEYLLQDKAIWDSRLKNHIFVEYGNLTEEDAGRAVKVDNQIVISLPDKLLKNSRNPDGSYNPEGVKKLRKIMAHELGHIVLHTEQLLRIDTTQGSKDLREPQLEQEADQFANELLRLRTERNESLYKSGNYRYF